MNATWLWVAGPLLVFFSLWLWPPERWARKTRALPPASPGFPIRMWVWGTDRQWHEMVEKTKLDAAVLEAEKLKEVVSTIRVNAAAWNTESGDAVITFINERLGSP